MDISLNLYARGRKFDSVWTGWPRAIQREGRLWLFYAAGGFDFVDAGSHHYASTGLRTVSVADFTRWAA